ncbi:MAG TPA: hypothetical protein PLT66_03870 [Bacillota bacterium]|nr:hypothetical protein [Bacillota bacterium]
MIASAVLMLLSAAVRLVYYFAVSPYTVQTYDLFVHIMLPVVCCASFAVTVLIKKNMKYTVWCVFAGCAFFIIKSFAFETTHMILCILLYCAVGALYALTAFGKIKTFIPIIIVFTLPLAVHIGTDIGELSVGTEISGYMPELSVVLIMAALLTYSIAEMKKKAVRQSK